MRFKIGRRMASLAQSTRLVSISAVYSQLSLILVTPLLVRIVQPEIFGSYQVALSVAAIVQITFTGGIEYVMPSVSAEASLHLRRRAQVFMAIASAAAACLTLGVILFGHVNIAATLAGGCLIGAIYGLTALDTAYRASLGSIRTVVRRNLIFGTGIVILQPLAAVLWPTFYGLVAAIIMARLLSIAVTLQSASRPEVHLEDSISSGRGRAIKPPNLTQNFAWVAGVTISNIAVQFPVLIIGLSSLEMAGQVAIAVRVVGVGSALLGSAVSQGFSLRFAFMIRLGESRLAIAHMLHKVQRQWSLIGIVIGLAITVVAQLAGGMIFGDKGNTIGDLVSIMAIPFGLQIVNRIVTPVYPLIQRNGTLSVLQLIRLLGVCASMIGTLAATSSTFLAIGAMSLASGVFYIAFMIVTSRLVAGSARIVQPVLDVMREDVR